MHTFALQAVVYYQSKIEDDSRFDDFLRDMKELAAAHNIEFGDFESFRLREKDFAIAPCGKCGHLTINKDDVDEEAEKLVSEFWYYIRRGVVSDEKSLCSYCYVRESAT